MYESPIKKKYDQTIETYIARLSPCVARYDSLALVILWRALVGSKLPLRANCESKCG